ncbi:hypothetical protein E2C01_054419 [Portunus trituberculatus]|uniref:Uncharacterized protein n=1 Tax=Portunus trituberculatus TaxID=210409 RepID=A0A5B7GSM4_PORTR|nr:hypothetical protein [Portunus trituberculatus]
MVFVPGLSQHAARTPPASPHTPRRRLAHLRLLALSSFSSFSSSYSSAHGSLLRPPPDPPHPRVDLKTPAASHTKMLLHCVNTANGHRPSLTSGSLLPRAGNEGHRQAAAGDLKEQSSCHSPAAWRPPARRRSPAATDVGPQADCLVPTPRPHTLTLPHQTHTSSQYSGSSPNVRLTSMTK